jgi:hypothetical protein
MFAHTGLGGSLPAPPWLLSYIGAATMLGTAAALRVTWPTARFRHEEAADRRAPAVGPGNVIGLLLLAGVVYAALAGPDSNAANIAPTALFPIWFVGLPIVCLLAGDVMRAINPFVPLAALGERLVPPREGARPASPAWTSAAFLAAFIWYFTAYYRPGSPRSLAVFLVAYGLLVLVGARIWGRAWLADGEGFAGVSAAVARIGLRRRASLVPRGTATLMLVLIGGTAFDAFVGTPFWVDIRGTSQEWTRTLIDTVGLLWLTAIAAGAYLLVVRLAERGQSDDADARLTEPFGMALVPLAMGWFLTHELTLLLTEGQNFYALLSDPLGKGWDLFGTVNHTPNYSLVLGRWVRWTQLAVAVVGHGAAIVLLHDLALDHLRRRPAMLTTWAMAVVASASITGAALLVLT